MSKIVFKSSILYRLSTVYSSEKKSECLIRFEIKDKKLYAVASNGEIACVEYLGDSSEPDTVCHLQLTNKIVAFAKECRYSDIQVIIETIPEIASGTIIADRIFDTTCFIWPESSYLDNWRTWFRDEPEHSTGFMFWNIYQVQRLFEASPSGEIIFPKNFDSSMPVAIRDANNSNWVGFFIPSPKSKQFLTPAEKPDWWTND